MPTVDLEVNNSVVKVEFEGPSGQRQAGPTADRLVASFEGAMSVVRDFASNFTESLDALANEIRPDEAVLTFGLKVGGETNWIVAKTGVEGTFQISMTWRSAEQGD